MFLNTNPFTRLSVIAVIVLTRFTTIVAVSPLPTCVVRCINAGLTSVDCTYPNPISCFCGNPAFVPNVEQCLQSSCTPTEQQAAVIALNSACGVGTRSGVYSFPPITPISTTSSSLTPTNSPLPSPITQPPLPSSTTSTQPLSPSSSTPSATPASAKAKIHFRLEYVVVGAVVILGTVIGHALLP